MTPASSALFLNPRCAAPATGYSDEQRAVLSLAAWADAQRHIEAWPGYRPTPLVQLDALAAQLGVASIAYKDEAGRFGLGSFKALGGAYAVERLLAGRHAAGITVACATDGNHGRSVAWGAQRHGCRCVIYVHAHVSAGRVAAIEQYGAKVIRVAGNYDDSVRQAAADAARNGYFVVSDTSYPGYLEVPRDVMQGYTVMVEEAIRQTAPGQAPTHIFIQGGVGGLAAAVCAHYWERLGARRPKVIVVEPDNAACLYRSAEAGEPVAIDGALDTIMAGLACGEVSTLAWRILDTGAFAFQAIDDAAAMAAMNLLADNDVPVVAGESAVAGLAGLLAAAGNAGWRAQLGLDAHSRVLLIGSEGDTDPALYQRIVGRSADAVRRQPVKMNGARLLRSIEELVAIGRTEQGGCRRIALTPEDRLGRDWAVARMRRLGLAVHIDAIGNIVGIRAGAEDLAPVMTGSHIDTVGNGGKYDGCYGVLTGLELVAALNERQVVTRRPLAVAIFTNEEGVRFMPDMMGSLVYAGGYPLQQALDTIGTDGVRLGDALRDSGYAGDSDCGAIVPHAFIELHIEQGPLLEAEGVTIGAVADLQGISWTAVSIAGQSNHAGTTPMRLRRDAGYAAARIATWVRELAQDMGGDQVATVGAITLKPNLINVVAGAADITVDLRNTDDALLRSAEQKLTQFLQQLAQTEGVAIGTRQLARFAPVRFDQALVATIEEEAQALGYRHRRMTSGAGHDAQMMARICPAAMIFVPSVSGISHNPAEYTAPADLDAGAQVFCRTMLRLAR